MEVEGEDIVLPVARCHAESSFWFRIRCQGHLLVSLCEVKHGYELGPPKLVDEVIHSGQGVTVELSNLI